MKRADSKAGIKLVSFKDTNPDNIEYIVTADEKIRVFGGLSTKDGKIVHEPFYIFKDIDVKNICETEECFVDYAKLTGVRSYCELAGEMRMNCLEWFGSDSALVNKIDDCTKIKDVYGRNDCLIRLAKAEKSIEPCQANEFDKQTYECMGEVAAIDNNASLCKDYVNSKSLPGTKLQHAYCIMGYVRVTSDNKACQLIDHRDDVVLGAMVENCDRLKFI